MDRAWIRKQLTTYYGYIDHGPEPEYMNPSQDVLRLEPTMREILRRLDPELADREIDAYGSWGETLDAVDQGLGILAAQEACETTLAADIPVLSADQFHPWVWQAARTLWDSAHYRHAVQAAATAINDHTQNKLDRRGIADTQLMQEAFSDRVYTGMGDKQELEFDHHGPDDGHCYTLDGLGDFIGNRHLHVGSLMGSTTSGRRRPDRRRTP